MIPHRKLPRLIRLAVLLGLGIAAWAFCLTGTVVVYGFLCWLS